MFKKLITFATLVSFLFSGFVFFGSAQASARTADWVVSVTYQNVGTLATTVNVDFYPEGSSTPIPFDPLNGGTLAAGAGASFFIGNVGGMDPNFQGNAVMSANQPLVATVVQFSQTAGFKMRLLSNGFQSTDASDQYLIATALLNKFQRTSVFSIQNTGSSDLTATVRFYDADNAGALASTIPHVVPAYSSKYIEMDNTADTGLPGTTTVFNGSAIVTVPSGGIVSSVSELYTDRDVAANFEGIALSKVANTIYMATALCRSSSLDTFYAVQNADLAASADVTVTYYDQAGNEYSHDGPYTLTHGQKKSINSCVPNDGSPMTGFTGSAVVTSVGAPIAVIGKAQCSVSGSFCTPDKANVFTAFLGEAQGASKMAMPFIRWASDTNFNDPNNMGGKQRSFIAIQNLESSAIDVNVKYYDKSGNLVATHPLTINGFAKRNSNPSLAGALGLNGMNPGEFGYYTNGSFGGAAIIEAAAANPSAKFVAIVRVQHPGAGEDYNAVPVLP